ncbi:MAG: HAD family phosphatase [Erysipelotrichaceae bacterium]|nr:HAD family phosphatase [Erysipelotrichaceae bacterium]
MIYKNILIDMGNVVIDFSPDYVLSKYTDDVKLINRLKDAIFFDEMWSKADEGIVSDDEIYENAIKKLDEKYHFLVKNIINTWYKYKTENLKMRDIFLMLKNKGYKLYLCSNAAKSFYLYEDEIDTFKYIDGKVISADIKLLKPSKEYFMYVLEKFNLKAEECFFIDDTIANVKGAYKLGIDGYWFNGNVELFYEFLKGVNIL